MQKFNNESSHQMPTMNLLSNNIQLVSDRPEITEHTTDSSNVILSVFIRPQASVIKPQKCDDIMIPM